MERTQPTTFNGSKILIKVGDGGDPEQFTTKCSINASRSVQGSATTVDTVVPFCGDNADDPAWTEREKDALSYTFTGEGVHDAADIEFFTGWLESAPSRNVEAVIADGVNGSYTLSGKFHLTEYQVSGARKEKAQASITLVSDGVVSRGATPPPVAPPAAA